MPIGSNLSPSEWVYRSASTRSLCVQQSSPDHVQVGEGCAHLQPVQVLGKPSVAGFAEAKYPFDYADRMLNLGTHLRLGDENLGQLLERLDAALGKVMADDSVIDEVLPEIKRRRSR